MRPITVKYHVPWSRSFWRHETSDDVIIFFAARPGQKLTLRCITEFCLNIVPKIMNQNGVFSPNDGYFRAEDHPNFASHLNCMPVGRASDSMKDPA